MSVNPGKIFSKKLESKETLTKLALIIASITFEGINDYHAAATMLSSETETDVAFAICYLRLKFNAAFSYNNEYCPPMIEQAQSSLGGLYEFSEKILRQTYPKNFFNYENRLITYICKLYQARINSLLNKAEEAHMQFIELW